MRRLGGNWWINYFKDIRDLGLYYDVDPLHVECLRYCYGPLLQFELETIVQYCPRSKENRICKNRVWSKQHMNLELCMYFKFRAIFFILGVFKVFGGYESF